MEETIVKAPTFGTVRQLLSRIDRYSICLQATGAYENYRFLRDVPKKYDALYVYGIGMIDTEFYESGGPEDGPYGDPSGIVIMNEKRSYRPCLEFRTAIEILLSEEPRELSAKPLATNIKSVE